MTSALINIRLIEKIDEIIEKLDEVQWIRVDKSQALIRISNNTRSFGEGILDMRVCVRDYFILYLFINGEKIYPPNFTS